MNEENDIVISCNEAELTEKLNAVLDAIEALGNVHPLLKGAAFGSLSVLSSYLTNHTKNVEC